MSVVNVLLSSIHLRAKPIPRPEDKGSEGGLGPRSAVAPQEKKVSPVIFKKPLGCGGWVDVEVHLYILGAPGGWVVNATPLSLYPGKELLCTKDNHISVLRSWRIGNLNTLN
jgi:hypothetical protein